MVAGVWCSRSRWGRWMGKCARYVVTRSDWRSTVISSWRVTSAGFRCAGRATSMNGEKALSFARSARPAISAWKVSPPLYKTRYLSFIIFSQICPCSWIVVNNIVLTTCSCIIYLQFTGTHFLTSSNWYEIIEKRWNKNLKMRNWKKQLIVIKLYLHINVSTRILD